MSASSSLEHLLASVDVSPDTFLQPSTSLQATALVAAKKILDPVVSEYSVFREVALKGLDVDQVWEQIRLVGDQVMKAFQNQGEFNNLRKNGNAKGVDIDLHSESEESMMDDSMDSDVQAAEEDERNSQAREKSLEENDASDEDESVEDDEFPHNPERDEESEEEANSETGNEQKVFKKDVHGLNDEFFSIDDFNRLTEQQDNIRSDNEDLDEIDYFAGIALTQLC
jgi:U3 small nucleolar RNA-associated protein MPP10